MKKILLLPVIILVFFSCNTSIVNTRESEDIEERFDSAMIKMVEKYPENYGEKLNLNTDSLNYSQKFKLDRRIFLPELNDLTLDYRSYTPCGGCWTYNVVHIYNDSKSFLLPLTDRELYWKISSQGNGSKEVLKSLNFNVELNDLIQYMAIPDTQKVQLLIDEIMSLQGYWKLDLSDIPKLTTIAHDIIINDFYTKSCRSQILSNLTKVKERVKNRETVYSDGINVSIFSISSDNEIFIENLNIECNNMMLY